MSPKNLPLSFRASTWAAYNSLIGNVPPLPCAALLPVINGSPTEWQNLSTAIKEAEKLGRCVRSYGKTFISFYLQLDIKAILLNKNEWESYMWFTARSKLLGSSVMAVDCTKRSSKQVCSTELGFLIDDIN